MAKAATVPPVDTNGETKKALLALTHCRKEIEGLPPAWQQWVISCLAASSPVLDGATNQA
jgi:hypothetical protein